MRFDKRPPLPQCPNRRFSASNAPLKGGKMSSSPENYKIDKATERVLETLGDALFHVKRQAKADAGPSYSDAKSGKNGPKLDAKPAHEAQIKSKDPISGS